MTGGTVLDLKSTMSELETLGEEETKKTYKSHGAQKPLFGVTLRNMENPDEKDQERLLLCYGTLCYQQL